MAAPATPALQALVAFNLDLGSTIVGALAEDLAVVFDSDAAEWRLLRADADGVTVLDTVAASGIDTAVAVVNDGVIASGTQLSFPASSGGDLTVTNRSWSTGTSGDYDRVYAVGDPGGGMTYVLSTVDGDVVFGLGPSVTDSYSTFSGALAGQTLIGAPTLDRWLRLSGDDSGAACTIELMSGAGFPVDSITFDHPDDSWLQGRPTSFGLGPSDVTWSALWWVKPAEHLTTYVGSRLSGDSYPYTSHVVTRTLDSTGDTLVWLDDEAELGTVTPVSPANVRPYAVAWEGQLAVSLREEAYG